ncbi:MAG: hypothetical protein M1335_03720 [Chloroflexi bacterium]|nr:hypothetical protein [Chloroflexota bacterium]
MGGHADLSILVWAVLLLVGIGLIDAPILRNGLPLGDDTAIHLYRIVDLDHLIHEGILYSRWQPDLVYGYGYPIFTYYAPLSAYLAEAGHLLGLSMRGGMALVFAALPIIGGVSTYLFLRRRLAVGPSLLGAIAYPTSLYFLYNVYVRGSISDALAMALFPTVLLCADRVAAKPSPARAAWLALAFGAALLSHDISGPLLVPLLILCGAWWSQGEPRSLAWLVVGTTLGIGVASFFLGPAILGVNYTQVPNFLHEPAVLYNHNFITLQDLLIPYAVAHPGEMLTNLPIGLGLFQVCLGLLAVPLLPWFKPRERGEVVVFAVSLLVCAGLSLPASNFLWVILFPLQIMQFPWRLLAMAGFVDSLLIGYAAHALLRQRGRITQAIGLALLSAPLLVLAVPFLYPLSGRSLLPTPSLAELTTFQQQSGAIGSTSNAEFLPAGLPKIPTKPAFPGADQGASLSAKLERATIPSGATIRVLGGNQLQTRLSITTPRPFEAEFSVFRFPGWSAQVDGRSVAIGASGPYHVLSVPIPSGTHILTVSFGETPLQTVFDLVSLLSFLVVVGFAGYGAWTRHSLRPGTPPPGDSPHPEPSRASWVPLIGPTAVSCGVVLLFASGVFDRGATPLVRPFNGQRPPGMAVASRHEFGPSLELLGYTIVPTTVTPGQTITLTLYWETTRPLTKKYSSYAHVIAPNGTTKVAQEDNNHVAGFPTTRWRVGAYALDVHPLVIPRSAAPGSYRIDVGVYNGATGERLKVQNGPTTGQGTSLELAHLSVTAVTSGSGS